MIAKNWLLDAADELELLTGLPNGNIIEVVAKHCPFKEDTAYEEVPSAALALLRESKKNHIASDRDSMDDCPMLRSEEVNKTLHIKHECDCGADAWNRRIDEALDGK